MGLTKDLGSIPRAITVDSSNRVGIGTTSPVTKFAVSSSGTYGLEVDLSGSNIVTLQAYNRSTSSYVQMDHDALLHRFNAGGSERMRINSNGDVGIGTSNPLSGGSLGKWLTLNGSSYSGGIIGSVNGSAKFYNYYDAAIGCSVLQGTSGVRVSLWTSDTERMRITSDGNVLVGTSTNPGSGNYKMAIVQGGYDGMYISVNLSPGGHALRLNRNGDGDVMFISRSGTNVGSISASGSTTSYNTSSDYRLKKDFKDFNGLNLLNNIKVYDYAWNEDNKRSFGVIAHELQEVVPNAVNGDKDGEQMQGVDYSKLVPILIKSIQELTERISVLENK